MLDANPREIRRQLEYKVAMHGGRFVIAARFYPGTSRPSVPSSRLCRCPGGPGCGAVHDRDTNAAGNLEAIGMATPESTRGDTKVHVLSSRVDCLELASSACTWKHFPRCEP
jgi:transposase